MSKLGYVVESVEKYNTFVLDQVKRARSDENSGTIWWPMELQLQKVASIPACRPGFQRLDFGGENNSVDEAQRQLGQLIAEACRGEVIVLTDGDKKVRLEPPLDLEEDSPALEAELLKAAKGAFTPYSSEE